MSGGPALGTQDSQLNSMVCHLCRQRKTRCDRRLPKCGNCTKGELDCFYVTAQTRPGLRAGYVSELEHRINALEKDVAELKSSTQPRPLAGTSTYTTSDLSSQQIMQSFTQPPSQEIMALYPLVNVPPSSPQSLMSPVVLSALLDHYITFYHPWFPILHKSPLMSANSLHGEISPEYLIILKAIAAVMSLVYRGGSSQILSGAQDGWGDTSRLLQREVIIHAMEHLSLQSLQALLIVSLADLILGRLSTFWKTIALCRSMGTQLGLRDLVVHYGQNYNQASIVAPRMLSLPETMIAREERVRAYWMIECLDTSSTLGAAWNIGLFPSLPTEILPCADKTWDTMDTVAHPSGDFHDSGPFSFSVYTSLVTRELNRVHNAMQEPYDFSLQTEHQRWLQNCNEVYDELCGWRSSSLETLHAAVGFDIAGNARFDVNVISANIALDSSIIAMYQKQAIDNPISNIAQERCVNSSNNIAAISGIVLDKVQYLGPHNMIGFFVAARFLTVLSKFLNIATQANTQALLQVFKESLKYWHLASILEKVLSTTALEHGEGSSGPPFPPLFFDLNYSAVDIYESLRVWSNEHGTQDRS